MYNKLTNKLLNCHIFIDNMYFREYIEFVITRLNNVKVKNKTQIHHIIPKCYYKSKNIKIDETKDNLVNLLYRDHIYAHYLLSLCTIDEFKYKMINAFTHLLSCDTISCDERTFFEHLDNYQKMYEEFNKYKSISQSGKVGSSNGKVAINKDGKLKFVSKDKLVDYLGCGWVKGGLSQSLETKLKRANTIKSKNLKRSEETRKKISDIRKKKFVSGELVPYNKGVIGMYHKTPEQIKNLSCVMSSLKTINKDGVEKRVVQEELEQYLKDGWLLGSPRMAKMNKIYKGKKVICITDDLCFNSLRECSEFYGINRSCIKRSIENDCEVKGKKFKYQN